MRRMLAAIVVLVTGAGAVSPLWAQPTARPWDDCVTAEIQARLVTEQPIRLSAQNIRLEGDTLRLSGQASIGFEGTTVRAEEIVINQSSKEVVLTTVRQIFVGTRSRCAPRPSSRPRVEYR